MFHNSCYVVLDLAVVPNPLFHNSLHLFVNFFVNFLHFVFWRFIELQASYRAQIKTVDRSRRPGKFFKYMFGACAPKKLRKTSAMIFVVNFFRKFLFVICFVIFSLIFKVNFARGCSTRTAERQFLCCVTF